MRLKIKNKYRSIYKRDLDLPKDLWELTDEVKYPNGTETYTYTNKKDWLLNVVVTLSNFLGGRKEQQIYYYRNQKHRDDGPAVIEKLDEDGTVINEVYYMYDYIHRENGPAEIKYFHNGNIEREVWYSKGVLHRDISEGPAKIWYSPDGY